MRRGVLEPKSVAAFAALLAIVAVFPMVIAFACTGMARFTLSPASAAAGDTVSITNTSGFQSSMDPVSKVVLRWNTANGAILWSGPPNPDGSLPPITFQVPSVPPSDGYTIIAYPYGADGSPMMTGGTNPTAIHSNAAFTVNGPPPPPAPQSSGPAPQVQAPAPAAPAQASNGAAPAQAEPPAAAAAPAPPANAGSSDVGNAGGQQSGGTQQTPVSHTTPPPTKPGGGSGVNIAIVAALVAIAVAAAALLMLRLRRRRRGPQPSAGQEQTQDGTPPDDHLSAAA